MKFDITNLLRQNIKELIPYSSARDEYKGKDGVFLDANENTHPDKYLNRFNRYPDPLQLKLKEKLSEIKGVMINQIFIGNGSDEAIDILFRAFCEPGKDNAIICPPTYGMYEVSAAINNVKIIKVPLFVETFQLDTKNILESITETTKLIFFCCPNNPTGNGVKWQDIKTILELFNGIVVIDEAYIDFSSYKSLLYELENYPNLVILQTLSKAWGLAGLRVGLAFTSATIINVFNKIKPPYNINSVSQKLALKELKNQEEISKQVKEIISEREKLTFEITRLNCVLKVYPSEANFILVKTLSATNIYKYLVENKIIVRNRTNVLLCEDCLRITIGTMEENKLLLDTLSNYLS